MKNSAQNKYPYDATVLGLDGIYQVLDNNSFLIKSDCIASTGNVITIGKPYIVFDTPTETGVKMSDVTLVDCYYREGMINLIVRDIRSKRVFTISQRLECPKSDCRWVLIDINFFIDRMNIKAIEDYCGCSGNNMGKKSIGEGNPKIDNDLLEFDF